MFQNLLAPHILHIDHTDFYDFGALPSEQAIIIERLCAIVNALHGMAWLSSASLSQLREKVLLSEAPPSQIFEAHCSALFNELTLPFSSDRQSLSGFIGLTARDTIQLWYPLDQLRIPPSLVQRAWMLKINHLTAIEGEISEVIKQCEIKIRWLQDIKSDFLAKKTLDHFGRVVALEFSIKILSAIYIEPDLTKRDDFVQSLLQMSLFMNNFGLLESAEIVEKLYLLLQLRLLFQHQASVPINALLPDVRSAIDSVGKMIFAQIASPVSSSCVNSSNHEDPWYHDTQLSRLMNFFQKHDETKEGFPRYRVLLQGHILAAQSPFIRIEGSDGSMSLFRETMQQALQMYGRIVLPINLFTGNFESDFIQTGSMPMGNHWVLLLIDTQEKKICYVDPKGNGLDYDIIFNIHVPVYQNMPTAYKEFPEQIFNLAREVLGQDAAVYTARVTSLIQQPSYNTNDCGVIAVANASAWLRRVDFPQLTHRDLVTLRKHYERALSIERAIYAPSQVLFDDEQCAPRLMLEADDFPEAERGLTVIRTVCFMINTLHHIIVLDTDAMTKFKEAAKISYKNVLQLLSELSQPINAELSRLRDADRQFAHQFRDISDPHSWFVDIPYIGFKDVVPSIFTDMYGEMLTQRNPKQLRKLLEEHSKIILCSLNKPGAQLSLQMSLAGGLSRSIDLKSFLYWIISDAWRVDAEENTYFMKEYLSILRQVFTQTVLELGAPRAKEYVDQINTLTILMQQYILATKGEVSVKKVGPLKLKNIFEPMTCSADLQILLTSCGKANLSVTHPDLNYSLYEIHQLIEFFKDHTKPQTKRRKSESSVPGYVYSGKDLGAEYKKAIGTSGCRSVIPIHLLKHQQSYAAKNTGDHYILVAIDTTQSPTQVFLMNPLGNTISQDVNCRLDQHVTSNLIQKGIDRRYIALIKPYLDQMVALSKQCELVLPHYSHQQTTHDSGACIVHYATAFLCASSLASRVKILTAPFDTIEACIRNHEIFRFMRAHPHWQEISPAVSTPVIIDATVIKRMYGDQDPLVDAAPKASSTTVTTLEKDLELMTALPQPEETDASSSITVPEMVADTVLAPPCPIAINKSSQDACIDALSRYFQKNTLGRIARDVPLAGQIFPCQMPRSALRGSAFKEVLHLVQEHAYSCIPINLGITPSPIAAQWVLLGFNQQNKIMTCILPKSFERSLKLLTPMLEQLIASGWTLQTITNDQADKDSHYAVVLSAVNFMENHGVYFPPTMKITAFKTTCESLIAEMPAVVNAVASSQKAARPVPVVDEGDDLIFKAIPFVSKRSKPDDNKDGVEARFRARFFKMGEHGRVEAFEPGASKDPAFDPQTRNPIRNNLAQLSDYPERFREELDTQLMRLLGSVFETIQDKERRVHCIEPKVTPSAVILETTIDQAAIDRGHPNPPSKPEDINKPGP